MRVADSSPSRGALLLARLDRIPIWPYPKSVLVIVGAGFFFAYFDIVTIGFALPVIAKEFGVSATGLLTAVLVGFLRDKTGTTLD